MADNSDFIAKAKAWLPTATMDDALDFYESMCTHPDCTDSTIAEIAKADRFFLLTHILHRPDAIHPWLYQRCREVESAPDDHLDLWARE